MYLRDTHPVRSTWDPPHVLCEPHPHLPHNCFKSSEKKKVLPENTGSSILSQQTRAHTLFPRATASRPMAARLFFEFQKWGVKVEKKKKSTPFARKYPHHSVLIP